MLGRRRLLLLFISLSLSAMGQRGSAAVSKAFSVVGKVKQPGRYDLRDGMRVVDGIVAAGGFDDFADQTKVAVVRGTERHMFNYRAFMRGKKVEDNLLLEDGDIIYVP
jgi:protein involved in polysaccharide export with SLBB domain